VSSKPATCDALARYVRVVADLFGLRDWEIVIASDHCDADTLAETECTYGQRIAVLRFNEKWPEWKPEDMRSTVVHELLHVHTEVLTELLGDLNKVGLEEDVASMADTAFSYLLERIVDQIAVAIAPYFPLIEDVQ
jgi:hypothetical protein